MTRRARILAVVTILLVGGLGVIASTQTWLTVTLRAGGDPLPVPGTAALPVLAPLCLAVLALGGALSIVGLVLRYVFGALTVGAAAALVWLAAPIAVSPPVSAVSATVTTATGISGTEAVSGLVAGIVATPWPGVTLAAGALLCVAGLFTLGTAHAWRRTGRRYDADSVAAPRAATGPLDAVDSWDDLSRGDDPTR